MPSRAKCFSNEKPNMKPIPIAAALAAIQVRGGTGSLRKMRAKTTVRSGLTLMTTSAFAVVVIDSANMKAVNITVHITPETRPGQPPARTARQGLDFRNRRNPRTNTKANRLRQKTCSNAPARSRWRVTTPAVLHSTGAATIRATAVAREMRTAPCRCARSSCLPAPRRTRRARRPSRPRARGR